ncbi:hypothetical protein C8R43DRAFT_1135216 [Mycena crocata]|nr:hypothetical protein C8R43DRAFT_1135216 [Mycena crocata]
MPDSSPSIKEVVANIYREKPSVSSLPPAAAYQPKSALSNGLQFGAVSGIIGTVFASLRNALAGKSQGFITPIGMFAAVGATYAVTEAIVANQRETDDALNSASAACATGFLLGLRARSIPTALGYCAFMGGMAGLYDYTLENPRGSTKPPAERSFFKPTAIVESSASKA